MNIGEAIDRGLASIAPQWAAKRAAARRRFQALATYAAAEKTRGTRGRKDKQRSANDAIIPDLPTLNARARAFDRDNPYIRSMIRSYRRNVIGTGITPSPSARFRTSRNERRRFNRESRKAFMRWANDPKLCDHEGSMDFWEMQRLIAGELPLVGHVLFVLHRADNGPRVPGIRLQAIETEQLDSDLGKNPDNGNQIKGGVEVDSRNRPVAYWIRARDADDYIQGESEFDFPRGNDEDVRGPRRFRRRRSERVAANRVFDLFVNERAGQKRGVTWLAPSLRRSGELEDYDEAERWAARLAACIGVMVRRNPESHSTGIGLQGPNDTGSTAGEDANGNTEVNFEPGMVAEFDQADDVRSFNPQRPGNTYPDFTDAQLHAISAGGGLSYEQTTRNFTRGNFSAQRQALLEDRREWEWFQQFVIGRFCQPVWRELIVEAVLNGMIEAPANFFQDFEDIVEVDWQPDGWEWIDPAKEAAAAKIELDYRLTTRDRILNKKAGTSYREMLPTIEAELEEARRRGVGMPDDVAVGPADSGGGNTSPSEPRPQRQGAAPVRSAIAAGLNGHGQDLDLLLDGDEDE